ncbi:gamma-mobile-trio protein GmtX [Pseudomonas alkylphenolica]|uniref:gamma-mobile-trio protein GmtX n=1 Tax=Pseudomonas alkylphenolica TaxID=237609 RepID=UPI00315CA137
MVDAQLIFEDLKAQATTRQAKSITILHQVLKAQYDGGERNFSIAEIARLSTERGGPTAQTIRNKTGLVFRQLIEAWAAQAGTTMKAPVNPLVKANKVPKDYDLLQRLTDPALRAVFGQIIAERNRFRNELNTLKTHSELIVDKRPVQHFAQTAENGAVQILPALKLNDMEIEALKAAVSDDFFDDRDWTVSQAGQVKDESRREIYKHGYVNAIKKILKEV